MRLVVPPLEVKEGDGFTNDLLNRAQFGQSLTNIVVGFSDEMVISLDGQWGEGKTTFIKMWRSTLSQDKIPNIYIDAFSNDFVDDPFISVASSITGYIETNVAPGQEHKVTELKEKAKAVGARLLSLSVGIGVKAATLGAINGSDIEALQDLGGDIAAGTSDIVGDFIDERISAHSKDIEVIAKFRELLSSLPSAMEDSDNKPLVVILDELDRCRPSFAVEMLEKIKHLFSVKNVVFVLVMNKLQLEQSIRCVYGEEMDASVYLQKFINLETSLPKQIGGRHQPNDIRIYSQRLIQLHEFETWGDAENIVRCVEALAVYFKLSLRQLEKVFTNLSLVYGTSKENHIRLVPLIVFLSVVKVTNSRVFYELWHQELSYAEVLKELGFGDDWAEIQEDERFVWIIDWIKFSLLSDEEMNSLPEEQRMDSHRNSLWKYNVTREHLIPIFAAKIGTFNVG